jgi:hypothetical protein
MSKKNRSNTGKVERFLKYLLDKKSKPAKTPDYCKEAWKKTRTGGAS